MKIISQFARDTSPLHLPDMIGDGVTAGPGGAWGWVELPPQSTDNLNLPTLVNLTTEGASDLRRLIPAGGSFHCKIQWGKHSGDDYRAQHMTRRLTAGQRDYIELGARRIEENGFPHRQVILGVRFDDAARDRTTVLQRIQRKAGAEQPMTADDALGKSIKRIHAWQGRMAGSVFLAPPATTQQLAWSLRRDLRRTVDWLPAGPIATAGQLVRLRSAVVDPFMDHVRITTDNGVRYLRMVTHSENGFPELSLPGGEWLRNLTITLPDEVDDVASMPVEVSIRGVNLTQKAALKELRDALALVKDQHRGASKGLAGVAPDQIHRAEVALTERIAQVQAGEVGMIKDSVTWIVQADNLDQLDTRTQTLIDFYGGMGITLWAPDGIQDLLYKQVIIGDTPRVSEFDQFRPWGALVGAWFHGGSRVGSSEGLYLAGNIGSTPGPFTERLTNAQRQGKAITSTFTGSTGAGKSTGVMLAALAEAVMGAWVLLADFKGDLAGVADACELFDVPTTRVSTDEVASGALCPFRYVPDPLEAASYALDNLAMILGTSNHGETESVLRAACNKVAEYDQPQARSTAAVIDELVNSDNPLWASIGDKLVELVKDPLARAVAGRPDFTAPQLTTKPGFVYLRFQTLRWPGEHTDRSEWKPGERLSMMLVQAAFAYATFMSGRVKGIPKVLCLTELHFLTRYDFGLQLIGNIAKTGRALDTNLLLDTQAVARLLDVPDLEDNIGVAYCFGVKSNAEADAQARLLGREPDTQIRATQLGWIRREEPGSCLARDQAGNVAPLRFDYMSAEIAELLATTPDRDDTDDDVSPADELMEVAS